MFKKPAALKQIPWPFLLSFLLWVFMFRGFLSGELSLVLDAVQYALSIKFYLVNLFHGVYPLWDPDWYYGIPWEFFLRRIGNYNPLYFVIFLLNKLGLSWHGAYLWFLAVYYFLGMVGFYLLAKRLVKDERAAFLGFLLLLFSSLSTMLFFSYIQLIFVPYFWFFYFLVAFTQEPKQVHAWGLTFSSMVILTTYIPFYFITIFVTFLILFVFFYMKSLRTIFSRYGQFAGKNRFVAFLCCLFILLSLIPGYRLYKDAASGELALPARQQEAQGGNIFTVSERNIAGGDITSQVYFDKLFSGHDEMELGVAYVPVFAYLVLLLGLGTTLNKKMVFMAVWAFIILLIGLTTTTPLYDFLMEHVFYFKYIRQSYYFFWVLVLPVFILLLSEQFRQLLAFEAHRRKDAVLAGLYVFLIHAVFAVFLFLQKGVSITSYATVFLSFVWCSLYVRRTANAGLEKFFSPRNLLISLIILVGIQPLQTYLFVSRNAFHAVALEKEMPASLTFEYQRAYHKSEEGENKFSIKGRQLYYSTRWLYVLLNGVDDDMFSEYARYKFIVYDKTKAVEDDRVALKEFERSWRDRENIAYIESAEGVDHFSGSANASLEPQPIEGESGQFKVSDFDLNGIKIETGYNKPKFLVYNDNYHSDWQAFVNGQRTPVRRTNISFKGVWLPEGKNTLVLRFRSPIDYGIEYFYVGLFSLTFLLLIIAAIKENPSYEISG
ncbi:MAG TPA: hypothetical protein VI749_07330 [Candidatus Omnitrophota bacterium]|nr:hypothetical protein [Candidatus Omnitrophota bacterium]